MKQQKPQQPATRTFSAEETHYLLSMVGAETVHLNVPLTHNALTAICELRQRMKVQNPEDVVRLSADFMTRILNDDTKHIIIVSKEDKKTVLTKKDIVKLLKKPIDLREEFLK